MRAIGRNFGYDGGDGEIESYGLINVGGCLLSCDINPLKNGRGKRPTILNFSSSLDGKVIFFEKKFSKIEYEQNQNL